MATHQHHHNHHHHHHQQLLNAAAAASATNCCSFNCCSHPPLQSTDPLIQAIFSQLLQQQHGAACCQTQTHRTTPQEQICHWKKQIFQPRLQENLILSSLLSRIEALEASFNNFSQSSASNNYCFSFPLRDVAARVIQTHFRAFLARRSRTLRQLKELALIKSSFNSLKSSVSKKTHFDFQLASQKAMDFLLKLDSIQGGDPMIRDGKRSISIDLTKFLEFVDGFAVRRREISGRAAKNVRFVGNICKSRVLKSNDGDLSRNQTETMKKLRDRMEKIHGFSRVIRNEDEDVELEAFHQLTDDEEEENPGVSRNKNRVLVKRQVLAQPRVKKSVSFAENGNVYSFYGNDNGNSNGSSSSGDVTLTDDSVSADDDNNGQGTEVEEIKGFPEETRDDEEENGGSLQSSDEETKPGRSLRSEGRNEINGKYNVENGQFVFSAPVPVKMESRAGLTKNRRSEDSNIRGHHK